MQQLRVMSFDPLNSVGHAMMKPAVPCGICSLPAEVGGELLMGMPSRHFSHQPETVQKQYNCSTSRLPHRLQNHLGVYSLSAN